MKQQNNISVPTAKKNILSDIYIFLILITSSCSQSDNWNHSTLRNSPRSYYISTNGNDKSDGLSPQSAWSSFKKINNIKLVPGDTIFLERNSIWREELAINNSGSKNKPIVITSYGTGNTPTILGSTEEKTFIKTKEKNIWKTKGKTKKPNNRFPGNIFYKIDNNIIWGIRKQVTHYKRSLNEEYNWFWRRGKIYFYCSENPNYKYSCIEVTKRNNCIYLHDAENIKIDSINMHFAKRRGISCNNEKRFKKLSGLTIMNCEISHIGSINGNSAYGVFTFHSNLHIKNNLIHDCGRRAISYTIYRSAGGVVLSDILIENNIFYNGFHTTSIDCQILNLNKFKSKHDSLINFKFANNLILNSPYDNLYLPYGNTSNDIFFKVQDTTGGNSAYLNNIYICNNIILNSKSRAILIENGDSVFVQNNIIAGSNVNKRPNKESYIWALVSFNGVSNINFSKNKIYGNSIYKTHGPSALMYAASSKYRENYPSHFLELDHNTYFQNDSCHQRIFFFYDITNKKRIGVKNCQSIINEDLTWSEYLALHPKKSQNSSINNFICDEEILKQPIIISDSFTRSPFEYKDSLTNLLTKKTK